MEIGLCWYLKDHGSLWTYDLTEHTVVDLETIIALATNTFVVGKTCMDYIISMKKCLMIWSMIKIKIWSEKSSSLILRPCFPLYMYDRFFYSILKFTFNMHTYARLLFVCYIVCWSFFNGKTIYKGIKLEVRHAHYTWLLTLSALLKSWLQFAN